MNKIIALFTVLLVLLSITGCAPDSPPTETRDPEPVVNSDLYGEIPLDIAPEPISSAEEIQPESDFPPEEEAEPTEPEPTADPSAYIRPPGLTPEQVVEEYFREFYRSYIDMEFIDIGELLDLSKHMNRNALEWMRMLSLRRRLILEHDLCYVETESFPYTIEFIPEEKLSDERISFWDAYDMNKEDEIRIHFVIKGDAGLAYPPVMAVNSEHSMRMKELDGEWKITFHYFPGSRRKFAANDRISSIDEDEMLKKLMEEFSPGVSPIPIEAPAGAEIYDGSLAAEYGLKYGEAVNSEFYNIGDWMGNCANFTSQCMWAGFGQSRMTSTWFAGEGGGSPSWENVGYFWRYCTASSEIGGHIITSGADLAPGDIVQTAPGFLHQRREQGEDTFSHSLIVVDGSTLMLAQHSPASFVYYSDMVNTETRIFRPGYIN